MDKYEYKIRYDEIKSLIKQREFQKAMEIADTIDWTRIRSVNTLCTISDLYKINRRYKDAKILLEQAYERYPNGRMIIYSLCELSIKMEEVVQAIEYYKQFVQMAPTDNGKFILQYKIYEAQDVSLEERIAVLEELKKRDYKEKWGYELAYLYHRIGLITKCVEECDELILWFREGAYVKKAMELKMLHQQLTESQQDLYESMLPEKEKEEFIRQNTVEQPQISDAVDDIQVKTMDMSKYNTINLQRELAESMKDVLVPDNAVNQAVEAEQSQITTEENMSRTLFRDEALTNTAAFVADNSANTGTLSASLHDTGEMEELVFSDNEEEVPVTEDRQEPYDPVKDLELTMMYNPDALPEALKEAEETDADNIDEEAVEESEIPKVGMNTAELMNLDDTVEIIEPMEATKVFNREELHAVAKAYNSSLQADSYGFDFNDPSIKQPHTELEDYISEDIGDRNKEELLDLIDKRVQEALAKAFSSERLMSAMAGAGQTAANTNNVYNDNSLPPKSMEKVLSQESDGQISLVVPEAAPVEKQITGQMNIADILDEWENTKKQNQVKYEQHLAQKVIKETGNLFTDTEVMRLDGILEKLERDEIPDGDVDTEAEYEKYLAELMAEENAEEDKPDDTNTDAVTDVTENNDAEVTETEVDKAEAEAAAAQAAAEEAIRQAEAARKAAEEAARVAEAAQAEAAKIAVESSMEETDEGVEELTDVEDDNVDDVSHEESVVSETPAVYEEELTSKVPVTENTYEAETSDDRNSIDENRAMNEDELALFAQFAQTKRARQNLLHSLDKISLAAYTGNVFVTGETIEESLELAKNVIRYVKNTDRNFTGKIAKVSGQALNNKMISVMVEKLANGGLIIEKASGMSAETTKDLLKSLNQEKTGIVVALQDTKKNMHKMMEYFDGMKQIFNIHIEVEELSDDALVAYGKKYAEHLEYSIDDMGILALHTRIDELQTSDHVVTVSDVREILDEAIEKANKKSLKHFTDVLFAKRYDEEDMIILRENDFLS